MRVKSLYISDYKNIKGQTFDFASNSGYIALIGENGSGKSNLLEAISLIFRGIYNDGKDIPFNYSVKYEIDGDEYERGTKVSKKNGETIPKQELPLPSSVIACYSGEDMRLWHTAYEELYYKFFSAALKNKINVPRMLYVNKYCWKIALIALLCDDKSKEFLRECLGINDITGVEISFQKADDKKDVFKEHNALKWYNRITSEGDTVNANLIKSTDTDIYTTKVDKPKIVFQFLYLLSMPEKNEINKVDKYITDISVKLGAIDFEDLSEGEKKLILIECITKVLGDKNSLILLDEPDAHTHIARKKELLTVIQNFEGQTVMTTHSPIFQNMMKNENVFFISDGEINPDKNDLVKRLSDNELSMLEGSLYTKSGNYLLVEGKSDVKCIKEAIKRFPKYKKLENVAIISFNGTSNAYEFYQQVFEGKTSLVKKIVFLFDYDRAGLLANKVTDSIVSDSCEKIFYQNNYNTTDPIPSTIANQDSFLLEDIFPTSAYQEELNKISSIDSFHKIHTQGKISETGIKSYIENNCQNFKDSDFDGFKPLMDKLMEIYNL